MTKASISETTGKAKPVKKLDVKTTKTPIWEKIQQRMRVVPTQEIAQLPADGAAEHDHYLYGAPKRKKS